MLQHPLHRRRLKQVGVVFELAVQIARLPHHNGNIEFRDSSLERHFVDGQPGNVKNLRGNILESKQHLEQRMSVQRALRH